MNFLRFSLIASLASAVALPVSMAQTTATTDPVGFTTVSITAGTGTAKRNTFFSLPLLETLENFSGNAAGTITGVGATTISDSSANWAAGALSQVASPYVIMITSGAAEGAMFLISSTSPNTSTSVTISSTDTAQVPNLANLGVASGNTYKIFACDTLSSFFGVPSPTGISGGTSPSTADTILITVNGSASTYYYNTTLGRWTRVAFGNPSAANTPLLPYYGLQYQRLGSTALSFVTTGNVPTISRKVQVKNSGVTLLAQYWPTSSTLSSLGLQSMPGWASGNAQTGDNVLVTTGGSTLTYYYDGTNWRRVAFGNPISNNVEIPIGSAVQLSKKGNSPGYATLAQIRPYSL
jgi:hypothetical protein